MSPVCVTMSHPTSIDNFITHNTYASYCVSYSDPYLDNSSHFSMKIYDKEDDFVL